MEESIDFKVQVLKALSDPTRLRILYFLKDGERCACEIVPFAELAQPTVSRHLSVLTRCGLLRYRKDGNKMMYSVTSPEIFRVLDTLDELLLDELRQIIVNRIGGR